LIISYNYCALKLVVTPEIPTHLHHLGELCLTHPPQLQDFHHMMTLFLNLIITGGLTWFLFSCRHFIIL